MINEFRGQYYFLSNFYPCQVTVTYDEIHPAVTFRSAEAAFQAQKAQSYDEFASFAELDASAAKRKGRRIKLRPNWEQIKDKIMEDVVIAKFTQNEDLKQKLLDTGTEELVEGNTWGDKYWGVCNGEGLNILGTTLMYVRKAILIASSTFQK